MSEKPRVLPWKDNAKSGHKQVGMNKHGKAVENIIITKRTKNQLGPKLIQKSATRTQKVILHLPCETVDFCTSKSSN